MITIVKKNIKAIRIKKYFLRKSIFLLMIIWSTMTLAQSPPSFYKYQESQSFKGIKFGTSFSEATKKLYLKESSFDNHFEIKNLEYLQYDIIKCNSGTASFTNSGKLYMITLTTAAAYPSYKEYNAIKQRLIYLFGPNDSEYKYDPSNKTIQYLQVGWSGNNLSISVMVNPPSSGEHTTVSISIWDNKLNNEAIKEVINSAKKVKVPGI